MKIDDCLGDVQCEIRLLSTISAETESIRIRDELGRRSLLIYAMVPGTHQLPFRIGDNERALPLMLLGNEGNVEDFVQNYI